MAVVAARSRTVHDGARDGAAVRLAVVAGGAAPGRQPRAAVAGTNREPADRHSQAGRDTIAGEVVRIIHRNEDTAWSVLLVALRPDVAVGPSEVQSGRLAADDEGADSRSAAEVTEIAVVGHTVAAPGQMITAHGTFQDDERFGVQFRAESVTAANPVTREGILRYLSSGIFRGIGPAMAEKIVGEFGVETLKVLDESPEALARVPGLGATRAAAIAAGWSSDKEARETLVFLQSQGISIAVARRIHSTYGARAIEVVSENPYRVCIDVRGIGFRIADAIAARLGVPHDSPQRLEAGIRHVMDEVTGDGHTGALVSDFVRRAAATLEVSGEAVMQALAAATPGLDPAAVFTVGEVASAPFRLRRSDGQLFIHEAGLNAAERRIARVLTAMAESAPDFAPRFMPSDLAEAERIEGKPLTDSQREAIRNAFKHRLSVLTGGPGCGKTTTLAVLTRMLEKARIRFLFAAPTGKAAQRITEATGVPASTLHSLMRLRGSEGAPTAIDTDILIVDECSMVDVPLAAKLVISMGPRAGLMLVGDDDQLPSVGPGRVLGDILRSGVAPSVRLDYVFRQGAGSMIKVAAAQIRTGEVPETGGRDSDFHVLDEGNHEPFAAAQRLPREERSNAYAARAADLVEDLVARRLPEAFGLDPADILVLSPMYKGPAGVHELNRRLQARLNPNPVAQVPAPFGGTLRVGDRVMQLANNKDYGISNGDMGFIVEIDAPTRCVIIDFAQGRIAIAFADLGDLQLAYAITVHKCQGSEAPCVIALCLTQHWVMLERHLLYTGITRARKLAVVVGQKRALQEAVSRISGNIRVTALRDMLVIAASERRQSALLDQDDTQDEAPVDGTPVLPAKPSTTHPHEEN